MRTEHDLLGDLQVPEDVLYGVQTMRAIENFTITGQKLDPDFIMAMAKVKKAAALANMHTRRLDREIGAFLVQAADEVIGGSWIDQFPVDPIQGGAGTSFIVRNFSASFALLFFFILFFSGISVFGTCMPAKSLRFMFINGIF